MTDLRISVTAIDAFMQYKNEELAYSDLIDRIKKVSKPSEKMVWGTALHAIAELPDKHYNLQRNQYIFSHPDTGKELVAFDQKVILPIIDKLDYVGGIFEIKSTKNYDVKGNNVKIVAKADYIWGDFISDLKFTFGDIDLTRYQNSYQWRFYLDVFEMKGFQYMVHRLNQTQSRGFEYYDYMQQQCLWYPEMQDDLHRELIDYVTFLEQEKLLEYVIEKPQPEAPVQKKESSTAFKLHKLETTYNEHYKRIMNECSKKVQAVKDSYSEQFKRLNIQYAQTKEKIINATKTLSN